MFALYSFTLLTRLYPYDKEKWQNNWSDWSQKEIEKRKQELKDHITNTTNLDKQCQQTITQLQSLDGNLNININANEQKDDTYTELKDD